MPVPCQGGAIGTVLTELALDGVRDHGMRVAMGEMGSVVPAAARRTYEKGG